MTQSHHNIPEAVEGELAEEERGVEARVVEGGTEARVAREVQVAAAVAREVAAGLEAQVVAREAEAALLRHRSVRRMEAITTIR